MNWFSLFLNMRALVDYLFEVSKETAQNAKEKAVKDIAKLSNEFAQSKFKDMNILSKLQRRARQVDTFEKYVDDINNKTNEMFVAKIKNALDKWKDGRKLSNGAIFKPLFVLTSGIEYDWGKAYSGNEIEWNNKGTQNALKAMHLTVIGLNSDFSNEKKSLQKINIETPLDAIIKEYEDINNELIDDLSKVEGLKYYATYAKRKNSKADYNTVVIVFDIDEKVIDINKASESLPGYMADVIGNIVRDRGRGTDKFGRHYVDVFRTKERKQNLN